MTTRKFWLGALLIALLLPLASCQAKQEIVVSQAWARAADAGANSAVYFSLAVSGGSDSLLAASSPVAAETQLHMSSIDDQGVASMQQQERIELPVNGELLFEPGGYHVMLLDLLQPLEAGDSVQLELRFEKHEPIQTQAEVRNP